VSNTGAGLISLAPQRRRGQPIHARTDLLGLDNTINRARALIAVGTAAIKLLGADYEERLAALEEVVLRCRQPEADESDV